MDHVPFTIIGAGPAGSLAAILLCRAGFAVRLIEQSRFPRDKVCGECFSATGFAVLERAGLSSVLSRADAVELRTAAFYAMTGTTLSVGLPRPMWGISRCSLDSILLDAARAAGATIHQPARCEGVTRSGGSFAVATRHLQSNEMSSHVASGVLLADGKGALLAHRPTPTSDFGLKAHFKGVDWNSPDVGSGPSTIELFALPGHYGGLAPIEGGIANASFSVPGNRLKAARGKLDELFAHMARQNPVLARRLRSADRVGDWHVSPLPRFRVQSRWPTGLIPIGNAAAAIEPVGGEGMGLALRSAELAVAAIIRARSTKSRVDVNALRQEYRALWRTRAIACRGSAMLISSPMLASAALRVAAAFPVLTSAVIRHMGK